MAAICVVLGLSGYYLPVLGLAAVLMGPVPIVVAHLRHGTRVAVLTALVAGILLGAFLGPLQGLVMGFAFGTMGVGLGAAFSRGASASVAVFWGALAVGSSMVVSAGVSFLFLGINPAQTLEEMWQAYERAGDLWARLGGGPQMAEQMRSLAQTMRQMFWQMWPAVFLGAFCLSSAVNWAVARSILSRLGYRVPAAAPFASWRIPRWTLVPFLASWVLVAARPHYASDWWHRVGLNLNILFGWAMILQGASAAWFFLRRWLARSALFLAVALLLFLPNLILPLTMWLGVFDLLFDYRRRSRAPGDEEGGSP